MLKHFDSILKRFKLGKQVTTLLLLLFVLGTVFSGIALSTIMQYSAKQAITSKALMIIDTLSSVRYYTQTQITPELNDKLKSKFLPQVVAAYSARQVFEQLRTKKDYSDFFYKEATLNPTNPEDKADGFDTAIVERFRMNTNLTELRGFRSFAGSDLFYIARPIKISLASCLQCHSTPDVAPKTMIERYGTTNGFRWKLNEIVGAQIISVSADIVRQSGNQWMVLPMIIVLGVFAVTIFLVNLWLKQYVIRPLNRMARVAEAVSTGDMDAEFEQISTDEVGRLAEAFTRMKTSLATAMKRLEKYRIERHRNNSSQ
jgi:HAMP domain-containing protein